MTKPFTCPSCGAPLTYQPGKLTVTCSYCHNEIIVPESLRPQPEFAPSAAANMELGQLAALPEIAQLARSGHKIEAIKRYRAAFGVGLQEAKDAVEAIAAGRPFEMTGAQIITATTAAPAAKVSGRSVGCVIWLVVLIIVASVVAPLVAAFGGLAIFGWGISSAVPEVSRVLPAPTPAPTATPAPTPTPGFASVALTFGSRGTGPAHFDDARSIALDGQGNIYVGEYGSGRIQAFTAQGEFITQWTGDEEYPLRDVAADRQGVVYAAQKGQIYRYQGTTGEPLASIFLPGMWLDEVAVTPGGDLLVVQEDGAFGKSLVRLDREGQVRQTIEQPVPLAKNRPASSIEKIAVDGQEQILILGRNKDAVYRLSAAGEFVDRFGGSGDAPGSFHAPGHIAVDGRGRIYVSDFDGVLVFSPEGNYLATIAVDGSADGLAFNDKDELFVVGRDKVTKYVLNN